jgi:AcrR family transcriptional regulator
MSATAKKTSRRSQILQKAAVLFREKGYNASSMRMLAESMEMEAASLYNHISSKEELLKDICFSTGETYLEHLNEVESNILSPKEKVEQVIRFQVKMVLGSFETVYVSQRDWKHLKDPFLSDFLEQRRGYDKRFAAIIEEGIAIGQFKSINPYVAVLGILSAIRGIEFWHRHKRNVSAVVLENDLVLMLLGGLVDHR